jgi:microcin C transport system substrate-binding protein
MFNRLWVVFFATLTSVCAEPKTAVSRFNQPKYPTGFDYFNYVNPNAPKGGRIKLAKIGNFDSLNMFIVKGIPAESLIMTFDPLMKTTPDDPHSLYGLVAEKAEMAPDYSQITFYLDQRARFHDGSPITAQDVKYTTELLRDKGLPRYRHYYTKIKEIRVEGERKITFVFEKQGESYEKELPLIIARQRILSKKFCESIDFANSGLTPLLGSGPYKVGLVTQGRSITFERVKDYWAAEHPVNKGQYNFDEVTIDYYKNAQAQAEAFTVGAFDCLFEADQKAWNTAYNFKAVKEGRVALMAKKHQRPTAVYTVAFNMRRPIFQDLRVRKALNLAFNFENFNRMFHYNNYKRMTSLFANTHFVCTGAPSPAEKSLLEPLADQLNPDIFKGCPEVSLNLTPAASRQNIERAIDLLKEAGWQMQQGVMVHQDTKKKLELEFMIKDQRLEKFALELARDFKKIGIILKVKMSDVVQYEQRVVESNFDMIAHVWANSLSPGAEQQYYFSEAAADQKGSSNYSGIKNPAIEKLARLVADAKTEAELITTVKALDRAVMGMYYMIPVYYDDNTYWAYWKDRLEFPEFNPTVGTNAIEWWWAKKT